jgi:3-hydroxyacyl-CoA dehydrogenase/enoyl-CoA hydratase/3-hydroxybutyryl-CoA epimerase
MSGRGFYAWKKGKPQKPPLAKEQTLPVDIEDRLVLRYLNECVACMREGVVVNADLLDGGMIFGSGFAPFRGGPMHYIHQRGVDYLKERLGHLAEQHGERFAPDAGWDDLVLNAQ